MSWIEEQKKLLARMEKINEGRLAIERRIAADRAAGRIPSVSGEGYDLDRDLLAFSPVLMGAHREALDRIERLEQENARLREAGALLAKGVPPFERRMHPAFDAACCVFEEER